MQPKKVLVIRCGALGDLVYATSVIDAMRAEYGSDTQIDFLSTPATAHLFKKDPRVHRVFPLGHKRIPVWLSRDKRRVIAASRKAPYDVLVNLETSRHFKSVAERIHARKKFGHFFEQIVFPPSVTHMVDVIRYTFKNSVGDDAFAHAFPRLMGTPPEETRKTYGLAEHYIVISPSNSHQGKHRMNYRAWPNEHWLTLINRLAPSIQVVVIGAPNEAEFFDKLRPFPPDVIDLAGKTPLPDLIGVIDGAAALVATDTGTAHMAAALDTEVFALIGPTPANQTGPYQTPANRVHILTANLPCSPCYRTDVMKNCQDNICMKELTADGVYDSIKSVVLA
jgi:ADP-heptose:LPS heptosyltransferase